MNSSQSILVCGGAGYVGAHMCKQLAQAGYQPVTFDNLSTGHRWAVKWGPLIEGDLLDTEALAALFANHRFEAVLHFAAKSLIAESIRQPSSYYRNNVTGTLNLLASMREAGVTRLVFSSSAAVYGNPDYIPIDEAHPTRPINPYGWSKLMAEQVIRSACEAEGLRAVCLRYFNAAGADPAGEIGERHEPETHLIPNLILAALDCTNSPAKIYGNDYDTPDGTCIRDFVHVEDLCEAHLRALDYLDRNDAGCHVFNLGTGSGYSVAEVVAACRSRCNGKPAIYYVARRPGDPPVLVACNTSAATALQWRPTHTLDECVADALIWHRSVHS